MNCFTVYAFEYSALEQAVADAIRISARNSGDVVVLKTGNRDQHDGARQFLFDWCESHDDANEEFAGLDRSGDPYLVRLR